MMMRMLIWRCQRANIKGRVENFKMRGGGVGGGGGGGGDGGTIGGIGGVAGRVPGGGSSPGVVDC